jgi:hypothetical protein
MAYGTHRRVFIAQCSVSLTIACCKERLRAGILYNHGANYKKTRAGSGGFFIKLFIMDGIVEVAQKIRNQERQRKSGEKKGVKLTLLEHIEKIINMSKDGLNDEFYTKAKVHLTFVKRLQHLNDIQALFLSHFLNRCDSNISISDISKFIGCSNIKLLQYMDDIDVLEKRRFIRCSRNHHSISYRVPREVLNAFRQNKEYQPKSRKNISIFDLFFTLEQLFGEKEDDELTFDSLITEVNTLLADNPQLEIAQKIGKYDLDDSDEILLLFFCHLFVNKDDDNIDIHDIEYLVSDRTFYSVKSSLVGKRHVLMSMGLLENTNDGGFEERESFKLTDKAKEELLGELNIKEKYGKSPKNMIRCSAIPAKRMFYNEEEHIQIEQLTDLLKEENFKNVQRRLSDRGMRTGFACLFHGGPGTGKTETVYQIARETGRDIMMVDISQTKSMWFGESEKKIKEVFERYKNCIKNSGIVPILLFNEADAVIGKRKDVNSGNVAQTENAIQNIILQEMENLEGIMIATTNLTQNLDKAFERRFLYKIKFNKPHIEGKKAIWQSIIPDLSEEHAADLATRYDFSGGQIENIARKCTVDSIILGQESDILTIDFHCRNEKLEKEWHKVGFYM